MISFIKKGINTQDATALPENVVANKIFYGAQGRAEGTMTNNGELNYIPSTVEQHIPAGYTEGGIVEGDPNLVSNNIRAGVSIFDVDGSLQPMVYTVTQKSITVDVPTDTYRIEVEDGAGKDVSLEDGKYEIEALPATFDFYQNNVKVKTLSYNMDFPTDMTVHYKNNGENLRGTNYAKTLDLSYSTWEGRISNPELTTFDGRFCMRTSGTNGIAYYLTNSLSSYDIRFNFYKLDEGSNTKLMFVSGGEYEIELRGASNKLYWGQEYDAGWIQNEWNSLRLYKAQDSNNVELYINDTLVATREYGGAMTGIRLGYGRGQSATLFQFFNGYFTDLTIVNPEATIIEPDIEFFPTGLVILDTTATADDIAEGKTAYTQDGKITGTLSEISDYEEVVTNPVYTGNSVEAAVSIDNKVVRGNITTVVENETLANVIDLTADKIKKGETILGIEGTAESSGFHRVSYVENVYDYDNPVFFNTNFIPNYATKMEFHVLESGQACYFCSSMKFSGEESTNFWRDNVFAISNDGGGMYLGYGNSTAGAELFPGEHTYTLDRNYFYVDGELKATMAGSSSYQGKQPIYFFAQNRGGKAYIRNDIVDTACKLTYIKIWDNGNLVRHFVPIKFYGELASYGYAMLDLVNNTIHSFSDNSKIIGGNEQ